MVFDFSPIGFTYVIVVPLLLYVLLPLYLRSGQKHQALLLAACILFFVSFFLPSPYIEGRDTQLSRHLIGGGVFSGFLWLYLKQVKRWNAVWYIEVTGLFALVSSLGVLNELYELILYELGAIAYIGDTSWDLLANTIGAALFYLVFMMMRKWRL